MKKLLVLVALLLILAPVSAMAGMTSASDVDLEEVTGQVGMTVDMNMSVTATSVAWGDSDGFGTYTTAGWLVLSSVSLPSISLSGVVIDVGGTATTSYLSIATSGNLVTGNLTVGAIIIGSSATSSTESLGELRVTGVGVSFGTIRISGHPAP